MWAVFDGQCTPLSPLVAALRLSRSKCESGVMGRLKPPSFGRCASLTTPYMLNNPEAHLTYLEVAVTVTRTVCSAYHTLRDE